MCVCVYCSIARLAHATLMEEATVSESVSSFVSRKTSVFSIIFSVTCLKTPLWLLPWDEGCLWRFAFVCRWARRLSGW